MDNQTDLISMIRAIGQQALASKPAAKSSGPSLTALLGGGTSVNSNPLSLMSKSAGITPPPMADGDWRANAANVTNNLNAMPYVMDPKKLTGDPSWNFNYLYSPGLQNSKQAQTIADYLRNIFGDTAGNNQVADSYAGRGSSSQSSASTDDQSSGQMYRNAFG